MQTSVCVGAFMQVIEGTVFQVLIHFDIEAKYCSITSFFKPCRSRICLSKEWR